MKFGKLIVGMAIALGTLTFTNQPVSATSITSNTGIYQSDGRALTIYSDPELKHATGRTLSSEISEWKTFEIAMDGNTALSYNLGGNQWVVPLQIDSDVSKGGIVALEVFSGGQAAAIYDNPFTMTNSIGTLNSNIKTWKVTKVAYTINGLKYVDLGNNQWVSVGGNSGLTLIHSVYYFLDGTQLYNQYGQATGKISNDTLASYRVFDTMEIDGALYVCLGDSSQWVRLDQSISQGILF